MNRNELHAFLNKQKSDGLYRTRSMTESPQGVSLKLDGKSYQNFCSNDYLGLANHPLINEAFIKGIKLYGAGSGASHLINGHSRAHHQLEEELAEFVQRPRALLFSTGYMANLGVISALFSKGDAVFEDRLNHASLLDGGLLSQARLQRYQHSNVDDLALKILSSKATNKLICTDGVFSMDGTVAPLAELVEQAQKSNSWLMVDDAHGLGTVGATGRGCLESIKATVDNVPILMGTLGKAFGTFGAFVAGDEDLIEFLIQRARSYIYTTAMPAAVAEATRMSIKLMDSETWRREQLNTNISYFKTGLSQIDIEAVCADSKNTGSNTAIQPIVIGDVQQTVRLSDKLKQAGILVSAIRPPTVPENTARLRITLNAEHSQQQIDLLLNSLAR